MSIGNSDDRRFIHDARPRTGVSAFERCNRSTHLVWDTVLPTGLVVG